MYPNSSVFPPSAPPGAPSSSTFDDLPPPLVDALAVLVALFGVLLAFCGQRFYQTALALSAGVCAGGATWYQLDATLVASGSLSPMAGVGVAAGVGIVALAAVAACSLLGFVFASASAGSTTVAIALHVASPSPPEPVILTAVAGLLAAALALLVRACSRQDGEEPSSLLGCCRLSKSRGDRRRPALPRRPSPLHTLRAERSRLARLVEASACALLGGACVAFAASHFLHAPLSPETAFAPPNNSTGCSSDSGECVPPAIAGLAVAAAGLAVQAAESMKSSLSWGGFYELSKAARCYAHRRAASAAAGGGEAAPRALPWLLAAEPPSLCSPLTASPPLLRRCPAAQRLPARGGGRAEGAGSPSSRSSPRRRLLCLPLRPPLPGSGAAAAGDPTPRESGDPSSRSGCPPLARSPLDDVQAHVQAHVQGLLLQFLLCAGEPAPAKVLWRPRRRARPRQHVRPGAAAAVGALSVLARLVDVKARETSHVSSLE
ncbi:hypothetical protein EMIHUDRAFT_444143 [Emiliania huxleyi CCMP1516]|uniref:DUF4203 domain-containing protein n=2 Tax=Emiliania huxleyi TaxID=2903 RepID=A0A0D3JIN1_EMIH1|nr:hypothetical protein EMIHUDRAFT_444143 [Emiliania huxleyi CCMP1516]EOD23366.1 hypothetical protein EMIHUDRAFT_444143 [Emiliania huxleyi CCMP1516]|eukprot:XP_005775795.1 hypothetical protein EMIHUDRAFT_444143 [Emiliania huxleyi CCMP1516]